MTFGVQWFSVWFYWIYDVDLLVPQEVQLVTLDFILWQSLQ